MENCSLFICVYDAHSSFGSIASCNYCLAIWEFSYKLSTTVVSDKSRMQKNAPVLLPQKLTAPPIHLLLQLLKNSSLTKHIGTKGRCPISQRWPCHSHLPCSLAAITSDVWIKRAQSTNTCRERWWFRRIRRGMILTSGTNNLLADSLRMWAGVCHSVDGPLKLMPVQT